MTRPTPPRSAPQHRYGRPETGWRRQLHDLVFGTETRAGRAFDLALIWMILASVAVVVLDSVQSIHQQAGGLLNSIEWAFTILFTAEYALRILCIDRPRRYVLSFYGVIDLLAVLPSYLGLFAPALHVLVDVRVLRLLRIFRILKLGTYMVEFGALGQALVASRRRILVFLFFVLMVVLLMGTLMYVVEGPDHGFTSIPVGVYWAITTMTTVGFGDIAPKTDLGRAIASAMMLLGWGTLAVPTGILTSEFTVRRMRRVEGPRRCPACGTPGQQHDARFCPDCGVLLPPPEAPTPV